MLILFLFHFIQYRIKIILLCLNVNTCVYYLTVQNVFLTDGAPLSFISNNHSTPSHSCKTLVLHKSSLLTFFHQLFWKKLDQKLYLLHTEQILIFDWWCSVVVHLKQPLNSIARLQNASFAQKFFAYFLSPTFLKKAWPKTLSFAHGTDSNFWLMVLRCRSSQTTTQLHRTAAKR